MPQSDILESTKLVSQMEHAILEGEKNIKHIPQHLRRVIENEAWKKRLVCGVPVEHATFLRFINTDPADGMGWNTPEDKEMVARLLREDSDMLRQWRKLTTAPQHAHHEGNNVPIRPHRGNSLAWTLDRLNRADRPDLYAKVVAKEMSANAAAIEAGFRRKLTQFEQIKIWWPKLTEDQREEIRTMPLRSAGND